MESSQPGPRVLHRTAAGALLVAALWAAAPTSAPAKDAPAEVVREGRHFRIICHFAGSEKIADEALAAVEPVFDAADAVLEGRSRDRGRKEVHVYRDAAAYAAADRELTGGRFARNMAFSLAASRSSHVALQPDLPDAAVERAGLSAVTRRTLVHEATHLALYENLPHHEEQPDWMAEGLATWLADRVLVEQKLTPPPERAPMQSTRVVRVQRLLSQSALPTVDAILDTSLDGIGVNKRYAVWWLFWRFLAETDGGSRMNAALRAARRLGGGSRFSERLAAAVRTSWGKSTLRTMDGAFRTFVEKLEPEWEELYRSLDVQGDEWRQAAFDSVNAIAWHTAPVGSASYTIEGTVELLPTDGAQMNLLLGRTDDGFISIALRARDGITLFDFRAKEKDWRNAGWMEAPELAPGSEVPFRVSVDGARITIAIADRPPLSWTLEDRDLTGPWGVGAQSSAAGIWRGVKLH